MATKITQMRARPGTASKLELDVCLGQAGAPLGKLIYGKDGQREFSQFAYQEAWLVDPVALDGASGMTRPSGGGCVTQWSRAARCKVNLVHAALVLAFIDDHTINER